MVQLPCMKAAVTVSHSLCKETILSKIINQVTVFRIDLSEQSFDESQKKYIDTIIKLDNSKTIMLETKGEQVKVKTMFDRSYKKDDTVSIEFSEYKEDDQGVIHVNYAYLDQVPQNAVIGFDDSDLKLSVTQNKDGILTAKVLQAGSITYGQKILFENYAAKLSFLSEKDKKDVIRGIQSGVNMIAASAVRSANDIHDLRHFLEKNNGEWMKIFARIHTPEAIENRIDIMQTADGLIMTLDEVARLSDDQTNVRDIMDTAKGLWCAIILVIDQENYDKGKEHLESIISKVKAIGVDTIMLTESIIEWEDPVTPISLLNDLINNEETPYLLKQERVDSFYSQEDEHLSNYIIYSAWRVTQELPVRAILCYSDNGYNVAKLASLRMTIPIIAFTKHDAVYRYMHVLRGIKGYKVSQDFNYIHLKRIGKEMIRNIFKGNISLDDKIVIMHANEHGEKNAISDMINGVEVYKFKNI